MSPERVGIVGSARNETNVDLVSRWRAAGLVAFLASPGAVTPLGEGDVAVGRLDVLATLDGVEPGLHVLHAASRAGVRIVNRPAAIVAAHDKLRTARLLEAARLPHPRTEHVLPGRAPTLEPPFVLKPRFGSWGMDVLRCDTSRDARSALAALSTRGWFRRQGAIVQELVPTSGFDVRVLVAGGLVVGAEERVAAPGEWRTNISLGGSHRSTRLGPGAEALAVAAVAALGGEFFGVDLLPVNGGYVVLEVNAAVEFDHHYSLPGGDVYEDIVAALELGHPHAATGPATDRVDAV